MKKYLLKFFVLTFIVVGFSACKKNEEQVKPLPPTPALQREFALAYNDADDETQPSFGTLDFLPPFVFDWIGAHANINEGYIHFGFGVLLGSPALISPNSVTAPAFYADAMHGISQWEQPLQLAGLTFDDGPQPNVNFDALTEKDIEDNVPDGGFGLDGVNEITIAEGQIIRFVQVEPGMVGLKYKGFIKVVSVDAMANPKTAVIQIKYIEK